MTKLGVRADDTIEYIPSTEIPPRQISDVDESHVITLKLLVSSNVNDVHIRVKCRPSAEIPLSRRWICIYIPTLSSFSTVKNDRISSEVLNPPPTFHREISRMKLQIFAAIFFGLIGTSIAMPQRISSNPALRDIIKRLGGTGAECLCCHDPSCRAPGEDCSAIPACE